MGHSHTHGNHVAHFSWCTIGNRHKCFCEVNRYLLSAVWGFAFATLQWVLATKFAGSHGAEGDASHTYADSSFILISAALALWKHGASHKERKIDDVGIWVNSLFLVAAGGYIVSRLVFGKAFELFSPGFMFAAGVVGLLGNMLQFRVLGDVHGHGVSMHSTTKQHVFYDMMYSCMVMLAAALAMVTDAEVGVVWKGGVAVILVFIAAFMLPIGGFIDCEEWNVAQWLLYTLGVIILGGMSVLLVLRGDISYIDSGAAILLATAMIASGTYNLYERYLKKGSFKKHSH